MNQNANSTQHSNDYVTKKELLEALKAFESALCGDQNSRSEGKGWRDGRPFT